MAAIFRDSATPFHGVSMIATSVAWSTVASYSTPALAGSGGGAPAQGSQSPMICSGV